jgi:hypothetical protein
MKDTDAGAATVDQVEDGSPVQSTVIISTRGNNPEIGKSLPNAKQERQKEPPETITNRDGTEGRRTYLPAAGKEPMVLLVTGVVSITDEGSRKREQKIDPTPDQRRRRQNLI